MAEWQEMGRILLVKGHYILLQNFTHLAAVLTLFLQHSDYEEFDNRLI